MFVTVSMVTDCLMHSLGSEPILPVSVNMVVTETETGRETERVNGPLETSRILKICSNITMISISSSNVLSCICR